MKRRGGLQSRPRQQRTAARDSETTFEGRKRFTLASVRVMSGNVSNFPRVGLDLLHIFFEPFTPSLTQVRLKFDRLLYARAEIGTERTPPNGGGQNVLLIVFPLKDSWIIKSLYMFGFIMCIHWSLLSKTYKTLHFRLFSQNFESLLHTLGNTVQEIEPRRLWPKGRRF